MSDAWMAPNIPGLGGSMFISNGGNAGLANAYASQASNQNFFNNQAATLGAANSYNPWANTPGGFGAQTANYAGAAAAYGRATGGFGKMPGGAPAPEGRVGTISNPFSGGGGAAAPSGGGSSVFDTGASPINMSGGYAPFGGGGFSGRSASPFSVGAPPINTGGGYAPFGGGGFAPPQQSFNNQFAGGSGGFNAFDPGIYGGAAQKNLGGRQAFAGAQAPAPTSVFDTGTKAQDASGGVAYPSGGVGAFYGSRGFGGFGQMAGPPAEGGAQPGPSAASLGASAGRMANSPFSVGTSAVPWQSAGGQAFPGGGVGSYQPTNQRDLLANIMSGSQGNNFPIKAQGGDDETPGGFHSRWGEMQPPATPGFGEGASQVPGLAGRNYFGAVPGGGVGADNSNSFFGGGYPGATGLGKVTPGGREMFSNAFGSPAASSGSGGVGSDMRFGDQNQPYAQPWHSLIPGNKGLDTPEIIKQVNYTAGRGRYDPAALANVIDTESKWNPKNNTGSYFGATQMGADSFKEAGGRLGGLSFGQYKGAPLEQQIPAYGDWLGHYAQPGNAAGLASSGISNLPVPMQSAILQGTQFGPNSTRWPAALAEGNMSMATTPYKQAAVLGKPPTINSMDTYFGRR